MTNAYFTYSALQAFTTAKASDVNTRFNGVVAGFDRLPHYDLLNQDRVTYVVAGGTGSAITCSLIPALASYVAGLSLKIKITTTNTGATTINVDGLGAKSVLRDDGSALGAGDLLAGAVMQFVYDGTDFRQMRPSTVSTAWGTITGTLSAQTDLQSQLTSLQAADTALSASLAEKAPLASPTFTGTVTTGALTKAGNLRVEGDGVGFSGTGIGLELFQGASAAWITSYNRTSAAAAPLKLDGSLITLVAPVSVGSGQITFPATANPSADVNTLDDYEEGVFTPVLLFGGAGTGVVMSNQDGRYTKVGRVVFWESRLQWSSKGTATGAASIGGLPFTSAATPRGIGNCRMNGLTAGINAPLWDITGSGTALALVHITGGAATALLDTDFAASGQFFASGHYTVA